MSSAQAVQNPHHNGHCLFQVVPHMSQACQRTHSRVHLRKVLFFPFPGGYPWEFDQFRIIKSAVSRTKFACRSAPPHQQNASKHDKKAFFCHFSVANPPFTRTQFGQNLSVKNLQIRKWITNPFCIPLSPLFLYFSEHLTLIPSNFSDYFVTSTPLPAQKSPRSKKRGAGPFHNPTPRHAFP